MTELLCAFISLILATYIFSLIVDSKVKVFIFNVYMGVILALSGL